MLLAGWKRDLDAAALKADPIAEMERLYKKVSAECKANPAALEEARQELVKLQRGDEENLRIWREMIALSRVQFDTIYQRLGVKFDYTLARASTIRASSRWSRNCAPRALPARAKAPWPSSSRTSRS